MLWAGPAHHKSLGISEPFLPGGGPILSEMMSPFSCLLCLYCCPLITREGMMNKGLKTEEPSARGKALLLTRCVTLGKLFSKSQFSHEEEKKIRKDQAWSVPFQCLAQSKH